MDRPEIEPTLGPSERETPPARRAVGSPGPKVDLRRSLVTAFCLFHMAAVVIFNLPRNTALGDVRAPFSWYAQVAWLNQEWAMFTTIPHFLGIRPVLVAKFAGEADRRFGPMLPGLRPYPADLRALYLMLHTLWPVGEYELLANGYLAHACRAIEKQTGKRPDSVLLRVDAEVLKPLDQVRKTGTISRRHREKTKAFECR